MTNSFTRKKTRCVMVGDRAIGAGTSISIQSMANTDTRNMSATIEQIRALAYAGCDIVRVAVVDEDAVRALPDILKEITVPLVADIHFDHKLALGALEAGVQKLRINPGNIGSSAGVEAVVRAAQERAIPIRIGVNAGSLEKDLAQRYGPHSAEALVESALREVALFEHVQFFDIVISVKASDIDTTCAAYRLLSERVDYPLHIGLTEAGTVLSGTVRSTVALSALLKEGIGDTLRVSLTAPPVDEVRVGKVLLESLGLREQGLRVIACPTCGRTEIDVVTLAEAVEKRLQGINQPLTIAVMGCVVNGPGEAKDADFGICGGKQQGAIYIKGELVRTVPEGELVQELYKEIIKYLDKDIK